MDSTSFPVTLMLDPVVTRFMVSSGKDPRSATTWMLCIMVPSLTAMKATWLFPLLVLTHPFNSTSRFVSVEANNSFTVDLFISVPLKQATKIQFYQFPIVNFII